MSLTLAFVLFLSFTTVSTDFLTIAEKAELTSYITTQDEIPAKIMTGYRRDVAPLYTKARYNGAKPMPIPMNMTATYVRMLSLDELDQTFSVFGQWIMDWYDFRLEWNPVDYDGVEMVTTSWLKLWIPDVMPVDVVQFNQNYLADMQFAKVSNFPFDTQTCNVQITTGNYDITEISVNAILYNEELRDGLNNGEWVATNFSTELIEMTVPYRNKPFPMLTFRLSLRRTPTYYVVMIIIPSFILTYLSIWGLFWSEVSEETQSEKLGLGFSSVLALVLNMQTATTSIPKISEVPLLSASILVNLLLVTVALVMITISARCMRCNRNKEDSEISNSCRHVVLNCLRRHIHRI